MSYLFNTNDFTGQSNTDITPPYSLEYSNKFESTPQKQSMFKKLFNKIFKGNKRFGQSSYKSRNGKTRVGNFLQSLLGDSQRQFKETVGGYIPTVETEVKLSNQMLIVIGAIIFFLFGKKLFK